MVVYVEVVEQHCDIKILHCARSLESMSVHPSYLSSHLEVSASQASKEDIRDL